jgi:hypothetical protein
LTGYTLTSGGDAPERDPCDWKLVGSNDGGATWVSLDDRAGQTFGERLQKRSFDLYFAPTDKAYRLKMSKVRDASKANCVQLGEMELLGKQVTG